MALTLTTVLMGSALAVSLSNRRLYTTDQNRTTLNQNLRIGIDLVGIDVRQAGQRLPEDLPAIEVIDGAGGGPDTLVLRRNLLDEVLPLCGDIPANSNANSVTVASTINPPQGCAPVPDDNADGWPDNLEAWRDYRLANGGEVWAYIYSPLTQNGEFFLYDAEDNADLDLNKANSKPWQHDYNVSDQARIYILEQKTYQLSGVLLQFYVNDDVNDVRNVIYNVSDFQVVANLQDGTRQASFGPTDSWSDLQSIEVTLDGHVAFQGRTMNRRLSSRFFPRNVLSV